MLTYIVKKKLFPKSFIFTVSLLLQKFYEPALTEDRMTLMLILLAAENWQIKNTSSK
jgi:hypothetical protein